MGRSLCACGLWSCPCIVHPTSQLAPATGDQRVSQRTSVVDKAALAMPCRHAANGRQPTKLGHSTAQLLHCTLSPAARHSSQDQSSPSPTPSFVSISISPSCRLPLSEANSPSRPSRPENKHPNSDLGRTSYIAPYRLNLALTQHTLVSSRNDLRLPFHPSLPSTTRSPLFTACRWFARATKFGRKYLHLHCISPDRPTLELER